MTIGLIAGSLMLAAVPAFAEEAPFSMRSVQLGISLAEFQAIGALPPARGATALRNQRPECRSDGLGMSCEWKGDDQYRTNVPVYVELGDGGGYPTFEFYPSEGQQRLVRIRVESNMNALAGMLPAFTSRFGPAETKQHQATTGAGITLEATTYRWVNATSEIVMETRCGQVNFLCVTYTHLGLAVARDNAERRIHGDPASRL